MFFLQCNVFLLQCKVSPNFVFYEVKPTFMGVRFLASQSFVVAMQSFGACYAKYCTAMFFCCTRLLHCKLYLLHCSVLLFYASSSTFRKQPQPPTVGPGGVPEEPPRDPGGSGRCPADNHESGLPRIMVTQGVPEGYGGVARLLEGPHEVLEGPRWGSWQVPDCENI